MAEGTGPLSPPRPGGRGEDEEEERAKGGTAEATRIRAEIEGTRAQLGSTVNAIEDRLTPGRVKEEVKERVVERVHELKEGAKEAVRGATVDKAQHVAREADVAMRRTGASIAHTIRENPVPAALVGTGVAWLVWGAREPGAGRARYRAGLDADEVERRARAMERRARVVERGAGEMERGAGEMERRVSEVAREGRDRLRRVETSFERAYRESPLAAGLIAASLGAMVGFALPRTQRENELFGPARDRVVERASEAVSEGIEKVEEAAGELGERVSR